MPADSSIIPVGFGNNRERESETPRKWSDNHVLRAAGRGEVSIV